ARVVDTSIPGIRRYDPLPSMGGHLFRFVRRSIGRAVLLAAVAGGLVLAPISQGGGFPGRNGSLLVVDSSNNKIYLDDGTTSTPLVPDAVGTDAALSPDGTELAY